MRWGPGGTDRVLRGLAAWRGGLVKTAGGHEWARRCLVAARACSSHVQELRCMCKTCAAPACRLDLFANTTAHERCVAALAEFSRPPGAVAAATATLRRALAGAESPETLQTLAAQQPEWMRGSAGRELRAAARMRLRAPSARLNASQVGCTLDTK